MADKQLRTRIALRRDIKNNFSPTFVPLKGELLFVQQPDGTLRLKVGDGTKPYSNLAYLDEENNIVVWGYYLNNKFYTSSSYSEELEKSEAHIYLDKNSLKIYIYDGTKFICVDEMIPGATANQAGILKLYNTHGPNTDGTITQKYFTEAIDGIEFGLDQDEEECLILVKPW